MSSSSSSSNNNNSSSSGSSSSNTNININNNNNNNAPNTKTITNSNDSSLLLVDISDALSERDRVRFTVHTRTKLPQFSKPVFSVVRQHEDFIWLHDCLVENDQYAGYIIPPVPPRPDFDSLREKLQRLGDSEASLTKDEFAKMKQELEAEYLAIFKKTVAMHEIFLQRLASHLKFREDSNFKIFLEYENELAVRGKSKREKLAGSIQNIGKSLTDFVITTSQVANSNSIGNLAIQAAGNSNIYNNNNNNNNNNINNSSNNQNQNQNSNNNRANTTTNENHNIINDNNNSIDNDSTTTGTAINNTTTAASNGDSGNGHDIDEQYFEKERLFLALYYNSIRETAIHAERVTQAHKSVADSYLNMAQQLVKLAGIEVLPVTARTKDSNFVSCPIPSLTLPRPSASGTSQQETSPTSPSPSPPLIPTTTKSCDKLKSTGGCANGHTSEGLKKLLLNVSDYLEQARKVEARIASDEDLKLTDTFLYYKRDTVAAQDLLMRRLRFMSEYENAKRNLEKARLKGRTAMQYADVIQKQARENLLSISKLAKQELIEYKQRRVASFKRAFSDLAELELKHLRSHSQLITNCLNICRDLI